MLRRLAGFLPSLGMGALLLLPGEMRAQDDRATAVREAERLRNARDFTGALRVLHAHLGQEPNDGYAIRLLAQTLYWAGERDSARAAYERALTLHPQDHQLGLDYGRMLVETLRYGRAREVLTPLTTNPSASARAATLLGTASYWQGNYTGAVRWFRRALEADSAAADARRQWREIAAATAPWIRLGATGLHDDQPLDRLGPGLETGVFLTPLWWASLRGETAWFGLGDGVTRPILTAAGALGGYLPALRLQLEAAGGPLRRSYDPARSEWTGRLAARLRLPAHISLGVRAERRPYLYTTASVELPDPVMERELAATLGLDHRGWLGEASYERRRFPDANTITVASAWLLAPLVNRDGVAFRIGYAVSAQDAEQTRFVVADTTQPLPGIPGTSIEGRYAPYHTPHNLVAHSVAAALGLWSAGGTALHVGGSWAFHARDDAPGFTATGFPPTATLGFSPRTLNPWQARVALEQRLAPGLTLHAGAERMHTVFYTATSGGIQLVYRFSAAAGRRVDRF